MLEVTAFTSNDDPAERDDAASVLSAVADAAPAAAWQALFGCAVPPHRTDAFLLRAIAWREQVEAHGDVAPAIRRDLQVAAKQSVAPRLKDAQPPDQTIPPRDNKQAAPRARPRQQSRAPRDNPPLPSASSQLVPGTRLVKHHGGRNHVVEVIAGGFLYEDASFTSLSAVAKHITGTHWNGLLFFGLRKRGVYPKSQQRRG